MTLRKRTVVVTGATSGIGWELTAQLAAKGHGVIAIGRNAARLRDLARLSRNIKPIKFDLIQVERIQSLARQLLEDHPDIDTLINNAGIQHCVYMDEDGYGHASVVDEIMINLTAPICLTQSFLHHFTANPRGHIINITGGLAYVPKLKSAVYSATKAGLRLFSDGLRVQTCDEELVVSEAVLPIVDTPMTAGRGGSNKISAAEAARQIIEGLEARKEKTYVGKARLLPPLLRFAPGLATRIFKKFE